MNIEEFQNRLDTTGLGKYFDKFQPLLRNTIRLYPKAVDEYNIAIGQTKIGGRPDLPNEISWLTETKIVETTEKKFFFSRVRKKWR